MFAGQVWKADKLQYHVISNCSSYSGESLDATVEVQHGASLGMKFTPDYLTYALSMVLAVYSQQFIVNETGALTQITFGITDGVTEEGVVIDLAGWYDSVEVIVEFTDFQAYLNFNAQWEIHYSGINLYFNNTKYWTGPSGILFSSQAPAPLANPMNNVVTLNPLVGSSLVNFEDNVTSNEIANVTAIVGGGWRFLVGSTWYHPPVVAPPQYYQTDYCNTLFGAFKFVDTWNSTITIDIRNERFFEGSSPSSNCPDCSAYLYTTNVKEWSGANITLIPNLPKGVIRMNNDYGALITRYGFPQVGTSSDEKIFVDGRPEYLVTEVAVYPLETAFLATVQNSASVIETPFTIPNYCLMAFEGSEIVGASFYEEYPTGTVIWVAGEGTPCLNCLPQGSVSSGARGTGNYSFPGIFNNDIISDGSIQPFLINLNFQLVEVINTWFNPHWSYLIYCPSEPPYTNSAIRWPINGSPVSPQSYWFGIRSQYLDAPNFYGDSPLPANQRLRIRSDVVTEPLAQNGLVGIISDPTVGIFYNATSWWGISRFIADSSAPVISFTVGPASYPAWLPPANVSPPVYGPSYITFTPTDDVTTTFTAQMVLNQYGCPPYQFPSTCNKAALDTGTNVANMNVYLVGLDNNVALVCENPTGIDYDLPYGDANYYCGDWAQDMGQGIITDTGVDTKPNGLSASAIDYAQENFSYGLLPGYQARRMLWQIEIETPGQPFTLPYPVFLRPTGEDVSCINLSGITSCVIANKGPGFRWGQNSYWNYGGNFFSDPPYPVEMTSELTNGDWLCWRRQVLQGINAPTGLAPEIGNLYVYGIEWTQVRDLWVDPITGGLTTSSFVAATSNGYNGFLVNSLAECPPMVGYPNWDRDANFAPTVGKMAQKAWSYIAINRNIVNPGKTPTLLFDPYYGRNWMTPVVKTQPGWSVSYHTHRVDSTIGIVDDNWQLKLAGVQYAALTPWHGYFWVQPTHNETNPQNWAHPGGKYVRTNIKDGNVVWNGSSHSLPLPTWDVSTTVTTDGLALNPVSIYDWRDRVWLSYTDGLLLYEIYSDDGGATFSAPGTGVSAGWPRYSISTDGTIARAYAGLNHIYLSLQGIGMPTIPGFSQVIAATNSALYSICFVGIGSSRFYVTYVDLSGNLCLVFSTDLAQTFSTPVILGSGYTNPVLWSSGSGDILIVALNENTIASFFLAAGASSWITTPIVKDLHDNPIIVSNDTIGMSSEFGSSDRIVLTINQQGTNQMTEWVSVDRGVTATQVTGL